MQWEPNAAKISLCHFSPKDESHSPVAGRLAVQASQWYDWGKVGPEKLLKGLHAWLPSACEGGLTVTTLRKTM